MTWLGKAIWLGGQTSCYEYWLCCTTMPDVGKKLDLLRFHRTLWYIRQPMKSCLCICISPFQLELHSANNNHSDEVPFSGGLYTCQQQTDLSKSASPVQFLTAQTGIELIEMCWVKSSLLELNADKTRIMPVGPSSPLSLVGSEFTNVAEKRIPFKPSVEYLWICLTTLVDWA